MVGDNGGEEVTARKRGEERKEGGERKREREREREKTITSSQITGFLSFESSQGLSF